MNTPDCMTSTDWRRTLAAYRTPQNGRAALELAVTAAPFLILWAAVWFTYSVGLTLLGAVLTIPTAGLLVRLFMIQHDCGHGSFFSKSSANTWVGRIIGVATMTPYDHWRRSHALHHASCGNLDRRGIGDVDTLTVDEYLACSIWGRLRYRIYRHPVFLFLIAPAILFALSNRLPVGAMQDGWRPWLSTQGTNLAILLTWGALSILMGWTTFLLVQLPIVLTAASIGVWLFYVQHQFAGTVWRRDNQWIFQEAALEGSSNYDLPPVVRWFSANIGIHHVHHLNSRIPFYRLPQTLLDHPALSSMSHLSIWDSFATIRLALWDEKKARLIAFHEIEPEPS